MSPRTRMVLGYIGIGLAATLIAGAVVWAIMSSRIRDAEQSASDAEERVTTLESQVESLTTKLRSAEASMAALAKAAQSAAASTSVSPGEVVVPTLTSTRQFCIVKGGTWEGATPILSVDYAEFLTGQAAIDAATAHGSESPPPNDYYIVNDNPKLREIPVDPKISVKVISKANGIEIHGYSMPFGQWYDVLAGMSSTNFVKDMPYWITITDDTITKIEEQYIP